MRQPITGLVDKPVDAQRIIEELTSRCLADRSDISLIAQESSGHVPRVLASAAQAAGQMAGAAAAAASAVAGFTSAMTRNIPGLGVLSTVGQLGAKLSGAVLNTAEDLTRAFVDMGVRKDLARSYADALGEGRILILVDAKTDNIARCARLVMTTAGAVTSETG